MSKPVYERIWRGRLHLGDEPGIYGDASYTGLCTEWPITLRKYDPKSALSGDVRLRLDGEDVGVFPPYPGHRVSVSRYVPAPSDNNPYAWSKLPAQPADDHRMASNRLELDVTLPGDFVTLYLSVRIEVDTTMHPGLYDDFVMTRLSVLSTTHFASFGFEFEEDPRTQPSA
jgi:hypothetical protein